MNYVIYFCLLLFLGTSSFFCIKLDPERFESPYYKEGRFRNLHPDRYMVEKNNLFAHIRGRIFNLLNYKENPIERHEISSTEEDEKKDALPELRELKTEDLLAKPGQMRIVWLGHSTSWIAINHKGQRIHIITDPVFANVYWLYRRHIKFPIEPKDLPPIDAVLVSHAHPDHLDIDSLDKIQKLNPKVRIFLPEGNRLFMKEEGIEQVETLRWWQSVKVKRSRITFSPAHHWTRMGLNDKCQSHWGSYIIKAGRRQIFFSGDTGYSKHFKKIAEKYPNGFDAALLEMRFQARWSSKISHLSVKEAIQASKELKAKLILPIHWGTFPSNHSTPLGTIMRLKELLAKDRQTKALFWYPGHPGLTLNL